MQICKAALQVGPVAAQTLGPAKDVLSYPDSSNTQFRGSGRGERRDVGGGTEIHVSLDNSDELSLGAEPFTWSCRVSICRLAPGDTSPLIGQVPHQLSEIGNAEVETCKSTVVAVAMTCTSVLLPSVCWFSVMLQHCGAGAQRYYLRLGEYELEESCVIVTRRAPCNFLCDKF